MTTHFGMAIVASVLAFGFVGLFMLPMPQGSNVGVLMHPANNFGGAGVLMQPKGLIMYPSAENAGLIIMYPTYRDAGVLMKQSPETRAVSIHYPTSG